MKKQEAYNEVLGYTWQEIVDIQLKKPVSRSIDTSSKNDYGCDPIGSGMFKMVPSGDIVDLEERNRRLKRV